jgi:hypothetical protein
VTKIDFGVLAQKIRLRLDEVFPEFTDPSAAEAPRTEAPGLALTRAGRLAASFKGKVHRRALLEFSDELRRFQSRFPEEKQLMPFVRVQLELCRYMYGCRSAIPRPAVSLLRKSFETLERMASEPDMPVEEKKKATRAVLAEYAALKGRLLPSRKRGQAIFRSGDKAGRGRGQAALPWSSDRRDVLKERAYYLIPVSHLSELTRFIEKEIDELRAAISELALRSSG